MGGVWEDLTASPPSLWVMLGIPPWGHPCQTAELGVGSCLGAGTEAPHTVRAIAALALFPWLPHQDEITFLFTGWGQLGALPGTPSRLSVWAATRWGWAALLVSPGQQGRAQGTGGGVTELSPRTELVQPGTRSPSALASREQTWRWKEACERLTGRQGSRRRALAAAGRHLRQRSLGAARCRAQGPDCPRGSPGSGRSGSSTCWAQCSAPR